MPLGDAAPLVAPRSQPDVDPAATLDDVLVGHHQRT